MYWDQFFKGWAKIQVLLHIDNAIANGILGILDTTHISCKLSSRDFVYYS